MASDVFYAWQSDTNEKLNRYLVRDALKEALKRVRATSLTESPRVDHDTKDVSGTPDVFLTILEKIEQCAVFVADVTPVAVTSKGKQVPNPNVMLELGYALAKAGDRRVLLVLNKAFGQPEDLPFDLARRRWPITYAAGPTGDVKDATKALAETLRTALQLVFDSGVTNAQEAARRAWEPVRRTIVTRAVKTYAAVYNGLNHVIRMVFELHHVHPAEAALVFIDQIDRRIAIFRQELDTGGYAFQEDLLPDLLILLNLSVEAFRRLRFFAQFFLPERANEDFVGPPPFEQILGIAEVIDRIRGAYPDIFGDKAVIGNELLSPAALQDVWERAARFSQRFFWSPETYIYSGRLPNVFNNAHLRRLNVNPPPTSVRTFVDD